jgi:hypothetical protein
MSTTRSVSVAAASSEPMTLVEAKKHLEIAQADETHDDHVTSLIQAARELWEHDTHSITTSRTVTESDFSVGKEVRLSLRPVISLTSVTFDATAQTGTSIDIPRRVVHLEDGYSGDDWNSVVITYVAGYASVPEIAKSAMKLQLSIMFDEHKDLSRYERSYESLVHKFMRSSYP